MSIRYSYAVSSGRSIGKICGCGAIIQLHSAPRPAPAIVFPRFRGILNELIRSERGAPDHGLHALLLDQQGELKAEYTREGLHLNDRGYQVWQGAIKQAMGWN